MTENIKIPYLKWVSFNQVQAEELWLNHTEAILMNYFAYFLPNYGVVKTQENKNYYWLSYNKIFNDMPTLDFSESTLRRYINKFIKNGFLKRIIITEEFNKSRAFYRATSIFLAGTKKTPFNFDTLYNNIELLLKEGKVYSDESNKLSSLLSSYKGKKKRKETIFSLEKIKWTPILNYLNKEFSLSQKWEWVEIVVWEEINREYVDDNIISPILDIGKDYWWINMMEGDKMDLNDAVKGKILGK